MNNQLWWFVARSGGIVAWSLLAASVLWGLALSTKALGPRPRANWLLDLHRFLGGLALVFTGIHVGALVLDSYLSFGLLQILVPFTSAYRASAVAWGVVGLYLLLAVEITSLLRSRLPKRIWRRVHFASFGLFGVSTLHGLQAGTDGGGPVLRWTMIATTAAVVALTGLRIAQATEASTAGPRVVRPAPTAPTAPTASHLPPPPAPPTVATPPPSHRPVAPVPAHAAFDPRLPPPPAAPDREVLHGSR